MLRALLLVLISLPAFADDAPKKLKTDAPVRQKRIKEFILDEGKRAAVLAEAAKWERVPGGVAAKDLELFRKIIAPRAAPLDAKGKAAQKGNEKFDFGSDKLEYARQVPPKYDGSAPVPLLIYLHGSNGPAGTEPWATWASSKGAILVAPVSPNRSYWTPVAGATKVEEYDDAYFVALMKAWREKFNVDVDRIYLSGFSAGGFGSWWMALRFPDNWAAVMPMAGGPPADWGERGPYEHVGKLPFWIWHGEKDVEVPVDIQRKGVDWLKKLGTPCVYKEYPGGDHNSWFGKDPEIAKTVLDVIDKQRRDPCPKRVVWTYDAYFAKVFPAVHPVLGAWWLEIGDHGDRARIEGNVTGPNEIDVTTKDVKSFTIHVTAELVDLSKPVVVKVNGAEAFNATLDVDFAGVFRRFEARPDPRLVVAQDIRIEVR